MTIFTELTAFIPKIKDGNFGEWVIDKENDGTPEHPIQLPYVKYSRMVDDFVHTLYAFCEAHPEFEHTRYGETLERLGREWGSKSMEEADVSGIDAKGVIAMLIGTVRAERFCDGALLDFFENGCILRWLERLAEIDNQQQFDDLRRTGRIRDKLMISGAQKDAVYFHLPDEPDGYLSNWYISPFDIDGQRFTSVEQYIMYQKCMAFGDTDSAAAVMKTDDTAKQQAIGRHASGYVNSVWAGMRQMVAVRGLLAKFSQNEDLKQRLMDTDNAVLVECARSDEIWACGVRLNDERRRDAANWTGKNILGFALMEVREILRNKD